MSGLSVSAYKSSLTRQSLKSSLDAIALCDLVQALGRAIGDELDFTVYLISRLRGAHDGNL